MSEDDEDSDDIRSNWIETFDKDELLTISRMAAKRAEISRMTKPELTKLIAEIVVGKVKDVCHNVTVFGISGEDDKAGYGNGGNSMLLHLHEAEEELGFLQSLTEDFLVSKKEWRIALAEAIKSIE